MGSITKSSIRKKSENTNLYKLARMVYVGLVQKLGKQLGRKLTDLERTNLWTIAQLDEEGQYMNEEVKEISNKIVS